MKKVTRWFAVVILIAIAIHRHVTAQPPAKLEQYQANIREQADRLPRQIGGWIGADSQVPVQAISLLRPNVMISKRYLNVEDGQSAGLLLVHCSDAHAMAGHYPLRCYPARGWKLRSAQPRDWQVGNLKIGGMEYEFTLSELGNASGQQNITVANFLMRPGGKVLRDMDAMTATIIGAGGQATGAGQVQVYFDSRVPQQERDEAVVTLLKGYRPVIDAILVDPAH